MDQNTSDTSGFWDGLGFALVIFALCMGIGGCSYLIKKGNALESQHRVIITNSFNNLQSK
jgi:hypothetical protein